MKTLKVKKVPTLTPKPIVKKKQSKPAKSKLSKSDPDYYKKIGLISARKRKMTSADFSAMAAASHPRKVYKGGRKPKDESADSAVA